MASRQVSAALRLLDPATGETTIEKSHVSTALTFLWLLSMPRLAAAEARSWILGEQLSWESQQLSSTAVTFAAGGDLELAGFRVQDNIIQQLKWVDGSPPTGLVLEHAEANVWDNNPLRASNIPLVVRRGFCMSFSFREQVGQRC